MSALADHDGVGGSHRGFPLANVEGNGVDEGLVVDVVIVNRPLVPRLVGSFVIDVSKVPMDTKGEGVQHQFQRTTFGNNYSRFFDEFLLISVDLMVRREQVGVVAEPEKTGTSGYKRQSDSEPLVCLISTTSQKCVRQ